MKTRRNILLVLTAAFLTLSAFFEGCGSGAPQITLNVRISDQEVRFISDTLSVVEPSDSVEYDVEPKAIRQNRGVYPPTELKAGIEADVNLKVWITKKGYIRRARVLNTTDERFNKAALRAIIGWLFTPAMKDGKEIDIWAKVPFRFRIREEQMLPPNQQLKLTK
jgi:TonB family protein